MMAALRTGSRPEIALMMGVAKVLNVKLVDIGRAAVREVVTSSNRLGVGPDNLPYVFWTLTTNQRASTGKKQVAAYLLMMEILERTGTMPNWQSAFNVPDDIFTDFIVDKVVRHMGVWALSTMSPMLFHAYRAALDSQVKNVLKATDGNVKAGDEFDFLRLAFRQVLSIKSSRYDNGNLLRQVVRFLPL